MDDEIRTYGIMVRASCSCAMPLSLSVVTVESSMVCGGRRSKGAGQKGDGDRHAMWKRPSDIKTFSGPGKWRWRQRKREGG